MIFSGHVHGGMVRLPIVGGLISPNRTLFPKYDAGLYEYNESNLVVSRGLSRGVAGVRLFNQPELVVVTLKSSFRKHIQFYSIHGTFKIGFLEFYRIKLFCHFCRLSL